MTVPRYLLIYMTTRVIIDIELYYQFKNVLGILKIRYMS